MKKLFLFTIFTFILLTFGFSNSNSFLKIYGDYTIKNAKIYINNEEKGYAPKTFTDLLPGLYNIKIQKDNYQPYIQFIELKNQQNLDLYISLLPLAPTETSQIFSSTVVQEKSISVDNEKKLLTSLNTGFLLPKNSIILKTKLGFLNSYNKLDNNMENKNSSFIFPISFEFNHSPFNYFQYGTIFNFFINNKPEENELKFNGGGYIKIGFCPIKNFSISSQISYVSENNDLFVLNFNDGLKFGANIGYKFDYCNINFCSELNIDLIEKSSESKNTNISFGPSVNFFMPIGSCNINSNFIFDLENFSYYSTVIAGDFYLKIKDTNIFYGTTIDFIIPKVQDFYFGSSISVILLM